MDDSKIIFYEDLYTETFVIDMMDYLFDPGSNGSSPYRDIDGVSDFCFQYYRDLTVFLKTIPLKNVIFIEPGGEEGDKYKITLSFEGKRLLLTSDTFGFSARDDVFDKSESVHPYGIIHNDNKYVCRFIADCIYTTRSLGGAFLWPCITRWNDDKKVWEGQRKSWVNIYRGENSFIEDRVDATLLSIKEFYEIYSKMEESEQRKKNVIDECVKRKNVVMKYSDSEYVFDWLELFGTFKNYVDYLCFNPFVTEDYEPVDIINSGKSDGTVPLRELPEEKNILALSKRDDKTCIFRMLNNVRIMTLMRTCLMLSQTNNIGVDMGFTH